MGDEFPQKEAQARVNDLALITNRTAFTGVSAKCRASILCGSLLVISIDRYQQRSCHSEIGWISWGGSSSRSLSRVLVLGTLYTEQDIMGRVISTALESGFGALDPEPTE